MSPHSTPHHQFTARQPGAVTRKATAMLKLHARSNDGFSVFGRLGWIRDGASGAWTPEDSWLDATEDYLRELVAALDAPVPPYLADALAPEGRDGLRAALRAQVGPDRAAGVAGGCEWPWQGCPDHGDALELRPLAPGWRCTVEGCGFVLESVVSRMRHCRRPAVAVLTGDPADTDGLAVCAGHRDGEVDAASFGGDRVWVRSLTGYPDAA